jgi:hypothetical protein
MNRRIIRSRAAFIDGTPTLRLRLTQEIAECYVRAALAHMRAMQAHDPIVKQELLKMEQRFASMARNYEFAERLSAFTLALRRRHPKR